VTEIPEHLLKRSKERRAAIGGEEAPAATEGAPAAEVAETTEVAPAPAAAAAVATPEPTPVPEPMRPEVAAALGRKKIPFWAMPVLAALPLWAYVYQATLEPAPTGEVTPVEEGGEVYGGAGCGSCHGAGGGGTASAPSFDDVVEATFPDFRDHLLWVRVGNAGWFERAGGETYGVDEKPTNGGTMPAHPNLTDQELAQVVLYERVQFGGMEEEGEDYELLLELAEGTTTFDDVGLGELSEALGFSVDDLKQG
jgi:mono/diheme cytochrome c family protein